MTAGTAPQATTATTDTERAELLAALATARAALTRSTRGLGDERLGESPTASALNLGGLIKHVASMEENWLRFAVEGPSAMTFELPPGVTWAELAAGTASELPQWAIDHGNDFRVAPGETLAGIVERYEEIADRTVRIVNAAPDLSATHPLPAAPWHEPGAVRSVRGVLLHLIAETSQHAGHADIIRETIDGQQAF